MKKNLKIERDTGTVKTGNRQTIRRTLFLLLGLLIMAYGVALSIKAGLGTSPISSVPYVLSEITPLTVGNITILMHCTFILLQILLLRRRYRLLQLLQLPVAVIFGYMTDFAVWTLAPLVCSNYAMKWIFCLIGIVLVAAGVSFEVVANLVTLAGEGLVLALCQVTPVKFSTMKVSVDTTLVIIACILSFLFLHGLYGVREGTIAAAFLVGMISRQITPPLTRIAGKIFGESPRED
ncbi:MAG: DUF6198 family protein [Lachnospiraceae bacterium]|nr:DUF6198 family protein [Lachnospiraceae bacterium]